MTDDSFNRVGCLSSESLIPRMDSLGLSFGRQLEMVVLVMLCSTVADEPVHSVIWWREQRDLRRFKKWHSIVIISVSKSVSYQSCLHISLRRKGSFCYKFCVKCTLIPQTSSSTVVLLPKCIWGKKGLLSVEMEKCCCCKQICWLASTALGWRALVNQ